MPSAAANDHYSRQAEAMEVAEIPYPNLLPSFISQFSCIGNAMVQQLAEPFDPANSHPAALEKRRYALSPVQAIAVTTRRQMKLVLRDKVLLKGRMMQVGDSPWV